MLAVKVGHVLNKTMLIGYLAAARVIMVYWKQQQIRQFAS